MDITQNRTYIVGALVALALLIGGVWYWYQTPRFTVEIDSRDTISSWDFQGSHNDDGPNEERVRNEIARMEDMIGGDQSGENDDPTDYSLYVGIAGQYTLLGDGKNTLKYLEKALAIDSTKTGLAWYNVAALMERFGAINTAREAYAHAVDAQGVDQYHIARVQFLMKYFSEDFAVVDAAIADAEQVYGDAFFVLQMKADWLEQSGRLDAAVDAWRDVREAAPAEIRADIDERIRKIQQQMNQKKAG